MMKWSDKTQAVIFYLSLLRQPTTIYCLQQASLVIPLQDVNQKPRPLTENWLSQSVGVASDVSDTGNKNNLL